MAKINPKTAKAMYDATMKANKEKIAQERYGEFGFDTLTYNQQQEVYKNYPKLPKSKKDKASDFDSPNNMGSPLYGKISDSCKRAAKRKFKVWPSAYASGWGVRCTKAGGPGNFGSKKK